MENNGYQLSRAWFDFCFANPELINPNHTAIFTFAIEHCNRLGWKEKFGFPSQMTMDALGIKNHHTYIKYFNDLVEWGFFKLIQKSKNQYSANIISLQCGKSKNSKALDKAFIIHAAKQSTEQVHSTHQSNDSIDKPINQLTTEPINQLTNSKNLEWFLKQFDEIFVENLKMTHKGKDFMQAAKESYAHLAADPVRLKMAESSDCKKLLNTWLSNQKTHKNGTNKGLDPDAALRAIYSDDK